MKALLISILIISSVIIPVTALLTSVKKYGAGLGHAAYGILAFTVSRAVIFDTLIRLLSGTLPWYMFSVTRPAYEALSEAVLGSVITVMGLYTAFVLTGRDRINGYSAAVLASAFAASEILYTFGIGAAYSIFSGLTYLQSFNDIMCASLSSVMLFAASFSSGILVSETALNRKASCAAGALAVRTAAFIAVNTLSGTTSVSALLVTGAASLFTAYRIMKERIIKK